MIASELRRAHAARPFQPFTIYLADGRTLWVADPEFLAIGPTGRSAAVYAAGQEGVDLIDLLLVTRIGIGGSPGAGQ